MIKEGDVELLDENGWWPKVGEQVCFYTAHDVPFYGRVVGYRTVGEDQLVVLDRENGVTTVLCDRVVAFYRAKEGDESTER